MAEDLNSDEVLRIIHSAYSALRGDESRKSLVPLCLDHVIQEHMDRIQNPDSGSTTVTAIRSSTATKTGNRLTKYARLTNLEKDLTAAVEAIKAGSGYK